MKNKIILALTYYNAPLMLKQQVKHWQGYSAEDVTIILIDDGSMLFPAENELHNIFVNAPIELYRITKDIPRNVWGARNLAFHIAAGIQNKDWVLCLDIDHVLITKSLEAIVTIKPTLDTAAYYHPHRYEMKEYGMSKIHKHSDSLLITPELYWRAGGYDEDLTDYYYNGAAFHFRNKLNKIAKGVELEQVQTLFYSTSVIKDASPMAAEERKTFRGHYPADKKPNVLNFEWERII